MWNLKVSTSQLSSLLGRSRFRSERFGGGRAAGELVLDCQSCPVYHLDGLIVLQSQLSSLENCVDLHSKDPLMELYLWCFETKHYVILAFMSHHRSSPLHFYSTYRGANEHSAAPRQTQLCPGNPSKRWQHEPSTLRASIFLFKDLNLIPQLSFQLQPSMSVQSCPGWPDCSWRLSRTVTTFMLWSSLFCLGNNQNRLMKTKHYSLKASTVQLWIRLSDFRRGMQDFILKYHRVSVSLSDDVKAWTSPIFCLCTTHIFL